MPVAMLATLPDPALGAVFTEPLQVSWQSTLNFRQPLPMSVVSTQVALGEFNLLQARTIAVFAALVAIAGTLAAIPLAASAGNAPARPAQAAAVTELLEVRKDVEQVNERAAKEAPPAVGNDCRSTLDVEGIGDTCVEDDGLLRVEQADGRSHTIHGLDAPPVEAAAYLPTSQSAVNNAGPADVTCVASGQPHYTLVYARPGNVASRYGTIAPLLRTEVYRVSAYVDGESRSVDPAAGRRLPVRCDGGTEPVVLNATLSGLSAGTAGFGQVVDALRAQGYEFNGDGSGLERYIVYYDAPSPSGAAGTGHVFTSDSSAGATNQNNKGGLYSVEYRYDQGGGVPHWEVLLHEIMHTMGAVVKDAPHASPAGHCRDGQDVMCYDDDGSGSYNPGACSTKVLDCNRDDYFNPAPGAGSYLATHWNSAATYNRFLAPHAGGVLTSDGGGGTSSGTTGTRETTGTTTTTPPPAPPRLRALWQSGRSNNAVGIRWRSVGAGMRYVVNYRVPGGRWRRATITNRTEATVVGLRAGRAYQVSVAARNTSGRTGPVRIRAVRTNRVIDRVRPTPPGRIMVRQRSGSVTFSWNGGRDNVGVRAFQLRKVLTTRRGKLVRSAGFTTDDTITMRTNGLRGGTRYTFQVVTRDAAGNTSRPRTVNVRLLRDRARPRRISRVRVLRPTSTGVTLAWSPSRDNVGVSHYVVSRRIGRTWRRVGRLLPGNRRAVRIGNLKPSSNYVYRVQARDSSGNYSAPSRAVVARTR